MQILSIKLCNLASLAGEQIVDFQQEPLKSTGLIAITGRTGAGKSTILDALCLALYGEIPRFQYSTSSKIDDYSGETDKQLNINDVRHILRRGTGQGFAEVEFIGLDKTKYRSGWKVRRARNQAKNDLMKTECFLQKIDDGQFLTQNKTEHKQLIPQLIGLSFAQFTRAVLLAQFEVGAFLKANDSERASLLEYLTNSKLFSVIGQLAYQKNKQYEDEYKQQQQRLQQFNYFTDDERINLQQQHQSYLQRIAQVQQQKEYWYTQQQIRLNYQQLCNTLQQVEQQYQHCLAQNDEIEQQKRQMEYYQAFLNIRHQVLQQQVFQKNVDQYQQSIEEYRQDCFAKKQNYQHIEQEYQTAWQSWQQLQTQQQEHQPHLEQALALEQQCDYLRQQYKQQSIKQKDLGTQIEQVQQHITRLSTEQQSYQQMIDESQHCLINTVEVAVFDENPRFFTQVLQEWQQIYQHRQSIIQLHKVDMASYEQHLQQKMQEYRQSYSSIEQCEQQVQDYLQHDHQLKYQNVELQQILDKILTYQQGQQHLQQQQIQHDITIQELKIVQQQVEITHQNYQQAEQYLVDVQKMLQQQRLLHSQNVQQLRKQLQKNQPCMVCGSTQHPFIDQQDDLTQHLTQLQEQQEQQAKQQRDENLHQWQQQQQIVAGLQSKSQQLLIKLNELSVQQNSDALVITQLIEKTSFSMLIDWTAWQNKIAIVIEQLYQHQQEMLQQQQQVQQNYQQTQQDLQDYRQVKYDDEQWQHTKLQLTNIEDKFITLLPTEQQQSWQQQAWQYVEKMQQQLAQRQILQDKLETAQQALKELTYELKNKQYQQDHLVQQLHQIETEQQMLTHQGTKIKQQVQDIIKKYTSFDDVPDSAQTWRESIQHAVLSAQKLNDTMQHRKQQAEQSLQQAELALTQQQTYLQYSQKQLQEYQSIIQQWLQKYPDVTPENLVSLLDIDVVTQCQQLEHKISNYQQQKHQFLGQMTTLTEQKQQYQFDEKISIEQANQALQQQQEELEQLQQQERILYVQLEQDKQQREQAQFLTQQLQELQTNYYRWHRIYEMIGDKKGEKFQKIAQQYYLDILIEYANLQLQQLAPRYELQRLTHSLGLAIKDREMNDELRTVLSLSGGESFLVSLALALAIAQMASGTVKLDTLFIDEGFGTLDQQALQMVMDSLERLQSQGRKVIVISHIAEIHERIPVQIQVNPQGAGQSKIMVVG